MKKLALKAQIISSVSKHIHHNFDRRVLRLLLL